MTLMLFLMTQNDIRSCMRNVVFQIPNIHGIIFWLGFCWFFQVGSSYHREERHTAYVNECIWIYLHVTRSQPQQFVWKAYCCYIRPLHAIMCLIYYKNCSIPEDGEDTWVCVCLCITTYREQLVLHSSKIYYKVNRV